MENIKGFDYKIGYYIYMALLITFFIFLLILIFKYPHKVSRKFEVIIGGFILTSYIFPLLELLSYSNMNSPYIVMKLPFNSFVPLLYIIGGIAILLPRRLKIRSVILKTTFFMSFALIYGIIDNYIYMFKNRGAFSELFIIYIFGIMSLILYLLSLVKNKELNINFKDLILSVSILFFIYLILFVININFDKSILGIGKYLLTQITYKNNLIGLLIDLLVVIISSIPSYLIFILINKTNHQL